MIFKGLDPSIAENKFEKAGRVAEEKLAFYLRRAFVEDKDILVFNNLRFENNHDAAQIDHLILHKYGMIIIESKSVTSKVEINEREEWIRWFDNAPQGMPSPIQQAKRQGEFLRSYLREYDEVLMGKILGKQSGFRLMPLEILVAISDSGIIQRSKSDSLEEVCKADQVPDRIRAIFKRWSKANKFLTFDLKKGGYEFYKDELSNIKNFLLSNHKPILAKAYSQNFTSSLQANSSSDIRNDTKSSQAKKNSLEAIRKNSKAVKRLCGHCSSNLFIDKVHNYYFKCLKCERNIPIKSVICVACRKNKQIRKRGENFYFDCVKCQTSKLFYINPVSK